MNKNPTLKDIAQVLGVSATTVSLALNDKGALSDGMRRKIKKIAKTMGYTPNIAARVLRGSNTKSIGVIINYFNNPFFRNFLIGLEEVTDAAGFSYWVSQTHDRLEKEQDQIRTLAEHGVDGFIILNCSQEYAHFEAVTAQFNTPIVLISHKIDDRFASITADNLRGGLLATRHLLSVGHDTVLHIGGVSGKSGLHDRYLGFCQALQEKRPGCQPQELVFSVQQLTAAEGYRVMQEILHLHATPLSVFVVNDEVALGALTCCRHHGLRCPEDVAMAGFSDIDILDTLDIPLTTVHIPQKQMGEEAARVLLDLIATPERRNSPLAITLPVSLVIRKSTAGDAAPVIKSLS